MFLLDGGKRKLQFIRPNPTHAQKMEQITIKFFTDPHHQWIRQNSYLTRVFHSFMESFTRKALDFLYRDQELICVLSNGKLSFTLSGRPKAHIIVIFPDLYRLLSSCSPNHGLAILAHELGHIVLEHGKRELSSLESQIEADLFAVEMGYKNELINILEDFSGIEECKARLDILDKLDRINLGLEGRRVR